MANGAGMAMALWNPPDALTLTDLRALVASVDLSNAPFKMWMHPLSFRSSDGTDSISVILSWQVPDRDDPKRLVIINHWAHLRAGMTRDLAVGIISGAVKTAFEHEFAECFKIGGVRLFDPHPPPKAPVYSATLTYTAIGYTEGV